MQLAIKIPHSYSMPDCLLKAVGMVSKRTPSFHIRKKKQYLAYFITNLKDLTDSKAHRKCLFCYSMNQFPDNVKENVLVQKNNPHLIIEI